MMLYQFKIAAAVSGAAAKKYPARISFANHHAESLTTFLSLPCQILCTLGQLKTLQTTDMQ
jgi:hypothetical protein